MVMYNTVSPDRLILNNMQKIEFIGNLGSNPVEKNFDNGKIAEFSVGVTEREFKTKDGRTIPATTEWFRCVARNGLADVVMKYTAKGHKVWVEAKMRTRRYTDKNGVERDVVEFIVKNLELLTPKERREDPVPAAEPLTPPEQEVFKEREEDDLPF